VTDELNVLVQYMLVVSRATRRKGPNVQLTHQQMDVIFQIAGGKDIVGQPQWQHCTYMVNELLELNPELMAYLVCALAIRLS
jgi:hypothetical protein